MQRSEGKFQSSKVGVSSAKHHQFTEFRALEIIGRTDFPNSMPDKMWESVEMLRSLVAEEGLLVCAGHGY